MAMADEEEECMDRNSGSLQMQAESMLFDAGGFDQMQNMRQEQKLTFKVRFKSKKLCILGTGQHERICGDSLLQDQA
jgi:hypothetical protein